MNNNFLHLVCCFVLFKSLSLLRIAHFQSCLLLTLPILVVWTTDAKTGFKKKKKNQLGKYVFEVLNNALLTKIILDKKNIRTRFFKNITSMNKQVWSLTCWIYLHCFLFFHKDVGILRKGCQNGIGFTLFLNSILVFSRTLWIHFYT